MEFSSAEADYQEAAKKEVANMLTVSVLSLSIATLVGIEWRSNSWSCFSYFLSQKPEQLERLGQYRRKVARKKVGNRLCHSLGLA